MRVYPIVDKDEFQRIVAIYSNENKACIEYKRMCRELGYTDPKDWDADGEEACPYYIGSDDDGSGERGFEIDLFLKK